MTRRLTTFLLVLVVALAPACVSTKQTAELARTEMAKLADAQKRLGKNRKQLKESLKLLNEVAADALEEQHSLTTSIAKAKLLENMRSVWTDENPNVESTRKEVALYHLFELSEASAAALSASQAKRRAAGNAVLKKYDGLVGLTRQAIASEKLVIAYLEKPSSERVNETLGVLFEESKALRTELAKSDNPRLQALAKEVESAESRVASAKGKLESALEKTKKLRGGN